MFPKHGDWQKIIRDGSKLQRWMPWGDPREYQEKERIRNVTIRQQTGLEETIIKEIEQNQLTWYGHVQGMAEGRLPKIALKWMPKQKIARGEPKKNWMEVIRKVMNKRNLNEGQWEDRKQWSLGVGQRRKMFWTRYIYIYIYIYIQGGPKICIQHIVYTVYYNKCIPTFGPSCICKYQNIIVTQRRQKTECYILGFHSAPIYQLSVTSGSSVQTFCC